MTKLPSNGNWNYSYEGYEFSRLTLDDLIKDVSAYMLSRNKCIDNLADEIEHYVCVNNRHMPQYERI